MRRKNMIVEKIVAYLHVVIYGLPPIFLTYVLLEMFIPVIKSTNKLMKKVLLTYLRDVDSVFNLSLLITKEKLELKELYSLYTNKVITYTELIDRVVKNKKNTVFLLVLEIVSKRLDKESKNLKQRKEISIDLIIVVHFLEIKLRRIIRSLYLCLLSTSILLIMYTLGYSTVIPSILTGVYLASILLYQRTLKYRVENGLFGSNYYEAKELLGFIEKNRDGFNNGHRLFNDELMSELEINLGSILRRKGVTYGH